MEQKLPNFYQDFGKLHQIGLEKDFNFGTSYTPVDEVILTCISNNYVLEEVSVRHFDNYICISENYWIIVGSTQSLSRLNILSSRVNNK